jgi:5-methylcytosine-specific restriction endonuclease McrA
MPQLFTPESIDQRRDAFQRQDWLTGNPNFTAAQRRRIRRRERGLCQYCNTPPAEGHSLCETHRRRGLTVQAAYRAQRDAAHREVYGMSRWRLERLKCKRVASQFAAVVG